MTRRVTLPTELMIRSASELRAQLLGIPPGPEEIRVDASGVQRVDAAGLQLVCAFIRESHSAGANVSFDPDPSEAFRAAARQMREPTVLGFTHE